MTPSLHKRITLGVIGFAAALFIALVFLEGYFIQRVAQYYVATRLEHDSETLLTALQPDHSGYLLDEARIHPIYQRPFSGHYYKIKLPDQTLRSRSLWDEALAVPVDHSQYPVLLTVPGPQQESLLVFVQQYAVAEDLIVIATAESLAQLTPLVRQAQWWSAATASLLLLLFVVLQYRWMSMSLAPLQTLKQQLKELQQGKREQLEVNRTFAELEPLINELNHLITALDDRVGRYRNAIGNLAHALKTPVSALQQLCETGSSQDPQFARKLEHQLNLVKDRINNELKRARIAGAQGKRGKLNVRDEIIDLTSTLKSIYSDKSIDVSLDIALETYITCDRQDFLELVGNLLDNAFKWAQHRIQISADVNGEFHLRLEDDGPGCDAVALNVMTERGKRLDEKVPGHGLGLSIAQDIVAQYSGNLEFSDSTLGGLAVAICIPQHT